MKFRGSTRIALFTTLMAAWLCAAPAFAYVPPSGFLVKSVSGKHAGIKGVKIRTLVKAIENGKPVDDVAFRAITLYDPQRRLVRVLAQSAGPENQILYLVERTEPEFTTIEQLLLQDNPDQLAKALLAQRIPIRTEQELLELPDEEQRRASEQTSLKRWQGSVAWVIGNPGGAQLWVEKGTFLPLRLITGSLEAQFETFHFYRGFPYPKNLKISEPGSDATLLEELTDVTLAPVAAEMKGAVTPGLTEAGKNASSSVRRLLESYFKYVR